jgi:glycerol transport system permease protein
MKRKHSWLVLAVYLLFTLAPIYWMLHMSLRSNQAITSTFAWLPESLSFANYATIFIDPAWYGGYVNSIIYVVLNTILSVAVALPAAYAFSRYSFLGDKHLFFWLLTNRMTPPAVFLLPFFQLYTAIGLMDTHLAVALAHMVFNVPLVIRPCPRQVSHPLQQCAQVVQTRGRRGMLRPQDLFLNRQRPLVIRPCPRQVAHPL